MKKQEKKVADVLIINDFIFVFMFLVADLGCFGSVNLYSCICLLDCGLLGISAGFVL